MQIDATPNGATPAGWSCDTWADRSGYATGTEARKAFDAGYSDGFHRAAPFTGIPRGPYDGDYRAGYAFGNADAPPKAEECCAACGDHFQVVHRYGCAACGREAHGT